MRSPTENRRQLFDIAVAGPLAGLAVAIPILYYGFQASNVVAQMPPELKERAYFLHPSFLFTLIGKIALGEQLTSGAVVNLSPIAFAGWLGLVITALNLVPVGQLDGGHIARAMFGTRVGGLISRCRRCWPGRGSSCGR
jgi:membrane-associated protease RseP (regulator of RpoE activity)